MNPMFSNSFLSLCDKAKHAGYPLKCQPGSFVGRGFADLGYEVFVILPGDKLMSLMSGEKTPLTGHDKEHLFSVPSVDEVVGVLEEKGEELLEIKRVDGRSWQVDGYSSRLNSESLVEVLLKKYTNNS